MNYSLNMLNNSGSISATYNRNRCSKYIFSYVFFFIPPHSAVHSYSLHSDVRMHLNSFGDIRTSSFYSFERIFMRFCRMHIHIRWMRARRSVQSYTHALRAFVPLYRVGHKNITVFPVVFYDFIHFYSSVWHVLWAQTAARLKTESICHSHQCWFMNKKWQMAQLMQRR